MIDHDVLQRVLGAALRTGGDFAEVFVEDKRSVVGRPRRRQGRAGHLAVATVAPASASSPATRPAIAHTADLSEAGLLAAAEAAAAAARAGGGGANVVALDAAARRGRSTTCELYPETIEKARKVELLLRADDAARATGVAIVAGVGRLRRQPPAHPRRQLRRPAGRRRSGPHAVPGQCVATGDAGMQTGYESIGHTIGFELFDQLRRRGHGPAGRPAGPHQAQRPPGALGLRCPSSSSAAAAACCSTRRAATASRPTSSPRARRCSRARSASRSRRRSVTLVDDGTMTEEWGAITHRRRGPRRRSATSSSRTACSPTTCGTSCGPARRAGPQSATAAGRATSTCRWCA